MESRQRDERLRSGPATPNLARDAGCAHYFASAYLYARGHATEDLTVEVDSEKQRLPVSRIGRLTLKVRLPAGLSEREIAGVERAIKGCPAYGTLLHPPTIEISVVVPPTNERRIV